MKDNKIADRLAQLDALNNGLGEDFRPTDAMAALIACTDLLLQFGKPSIQTLTGLLVQQQKDYGKDDHVATRVLEQAFNGLGIMSRQVDDIQLLFGVISRLVLVDGIVQDGAAETDDDLRARNADLTQRLELAEDAVLRVSEHGIDTLTPPDESVSAPPPPTPSDEPGWGDDEHSVELPQGMGGGNIPPVG